VNKISAIFGPVLVLAIAVIFILQFQAVTPNAVKGDSGPDCAVEVRGACLKRQTYQAAYRLLGSRADAGRLRSMGFGKKVAEGLLESWLLVQDAKRLGLSVSDDDVSAEIVAGRAHVSLPAADVRGLGYSLQLGEDGIRPIPVKNLKTKKFDPKYYEKQVRSFTLLSPTEFREYQKNEILAARMRDLIKSRVRVGENEGFEQYAREQSKVTLEYVRFDRRFYADLLVDMSQKAIDFWADAHKDIVDKTWESRKAQVLPECRSVREIFLKIDETATDDDKTTLRARMEKARERIVLGNEDFSDVARSVSEGATAARGGEIGCLLKGKAPKPLEEAVAALAPGKVSDVVATDHGYYLVKLDQIAKDADAEKLGRAQTVKELYVTHEAERLAAEGSKQVAAAAKGGKSLKDALDLYLAELPKPPEPADKKDKKKDEKKKDGDKKDEKKDGDKKDEGRAPLTRENHPSRPTLETTLPFNATGNPIPGVRNAEELVRAAFALEKPGDAPSDTVGFDNGYLAVQLKEKTPVTKEQWEKSKEFYLGAMRGEKARDALVAYVKRLRAQIGSDAKTAPFVDEKPGKPGEAPAPAPMDDEPFE
jgi:peptidyl-prolyl cis-trans isomerase D